MKPRIQKAIDLIQKGGLDKTYLGLCLICEEYDASPESLSPLEKTLMPLIKEIVARTQNNLGVESFDEDEDRIRGAA